MYNEWFEIKYGQEKKRIVQMRFWRNSHELLIIKEKNSDQGTSGWSSKNIHSKHSYQTNLPLDRGTQTHEKKYESISHEKLCRFFLFHLLQAVWHHSMSK